MDGLYTNRNKFSDFVQTGINTNIFDANQVYIAVAFFTEPDVVHQIAKADCHVRMIVRLGFPTNPTALKKLTNNPNIELRFYTDRSFHPKLYIFGDKVALVGSANLTKAAILTNQEVVVSIPSEDERFTELVSLFVDYWDSANVLTDEELAKYDNIYSQYKNAISSVHKIDSQVQKDIGKIVFANINRGKQNKSKQNIFIDNYRKTYQESVTAFNKIKECYEVIGKRKSFDSFPLRLEIDSFLSFVRDKYAKKEIWRNQPLGWNNDRKQLLEAHILEWHNTSWLHFEERIIKENYPLISKVFSSRQAIDGSTPEEIAEALTVLHSFHDRLRFYTGGLETLKQSFVAENDEDQIKEGLKYLLFGDGEIVRRMCDLIYDSSYKLNVFGQSNVQELIGWINKEDLPVINGRTTKVLRYYGFDVRQL